VKTISVIKILQNRLGPWTSKACFYKTWTFEEYWWSYEIQ